MTQHRETSVEPSTSECILLGLLRPCTSASRPGAMLKQRSKLVRFSTQELELQLYNQAAELKSAKAALATARHGFANDLAGASRCRCLDTSICSANNHANGEQCQRRPYGEVCSYSKSHARDAYLA